MGTATATRPSKTQRCGAPKKSGKKGAKCRQRLGQLGWCRYHGQRAFNGQHVDEIEQQAAELAARSADDPLAEPVDAKTLVREKTDEMKAAVEVLMADPEGLPKLLAMRQRFHAYSLNNTLLMWAQAKDRGFELSMPAPKSTWDELGRTPKDGEAPLLVYVPQKVRVRKRNADGSFVKDDDGNYEYEEGKTRTVFKLSGKVYDVSQTEGDPLPELPISKLNGAAPDELKAHLASVADDAGITVDYDQLSDMPGVNGYYERGKNHIVIREGNEDAQQVKTLIHELGHAFDPEPPSSGSYSTSTRHRGDAEAVAEMSAYIIADRFGMSTSDYSVGYVASWTRGDPQRLEQVITRAETAVGKLLPPTQSSQQMEKVRETASAKAKQRAKERAAKRRAKKNTNK